MRRSMLFFVLAMVVAACGNSTPKAVPHRPSPSPTATGDLIDIPGATAQPFHARYAGTSDVGGGSALQMTIVRINDKPAFSPTVILGSPGQTLSISIKNVTPASHTFTIPGAHIDVDIGAGKTATVSVTFPTSGNVVFYCRFHAIDEPLSQAGILVAKS